MPRKTETNLSPCLINSLWQTDLTCKFIFFNAWSPNSRRGIQHCFSARLGKVQDVEGESCYQNCQEWEMGVLGCTKRHVRSYSYGKDSKCSQDHMITQAGKELRWRLAQSHAQARLALRLLKALSSRVPNPPRMEAAQPLWATRSTAVLSSWWKGFSLCLVWTTLVSSYALWQ